MSYPAFQPQQQYAQDAQSVFENRKRIPFIPSFSPKLNKVIGGGFRAEGTYIFSGGPGSGKTTFALNIVDGILNETNANIIYLGAELTPQLILDRLAANKLQMDWIDVVDLDPEQQPDKYEAYRSYVNSIEGRFWILSPQQCLRYQECTGLILGHIKERFAPENAPPFILIVDYIQDLARGFASKYRDAREATSQISRELREFSQHYGCPLVILSSTGRQFYNGSEEVNDESLIASAKDSGEVEFDATGVVYLRRHTTGDATYAELIVAKNRFGRAPASILYQMDPGQGRYIETNIEAKQILLVDYVKKIYTLVKSNPGKFAKPQNIAKTLNIPWKDAANAINLMLMGATPYKMIDNHNGVNGYFALEEPTIEALT